jgi:hypothetical protein
MATVVALDASPANVLRSLRGSIVDARIAYPDVLHVEVRDSRGDLGVSPRKTLSGRRQTRANWSGAPSMMLP